MTGAMGRWVSWTAAIALATACSRASAAEAPTAAIAPPEARVRSFPMPAGPGVAAEGGKSGGVGPVGSTATALVLVLAGGGATAWVLRRKAAGYAPGRAVDGREAIRVVGRAAIGSRQAVVLVRVGSKRVLLGVGGGGSPTLLADWPGDEPLAEEARACD